MVRDHLTVFNTSGTGIPVRHMVTRVAFEITSGHGTREAGVVMGAGESLFNLFYNFVSYYGACVLARAENTCLP